jgi:Fe-S oxidoreductase
LTGQLGLNGLTDPLLFEVLDLCLECKACKSECPTNLDMARLKAEFLHQYYREHGLPWRNWIFGNVARLARTGWGSWLARTKLGRWFNEKLFGIDRRRIPPKLARVEFVMEWAGDHFEHERRVGGETRPAILVFPDTFTNYYEPALGMAAVRVLRSAGCGVRVGFPAGWKLPHHGRPAEIPVGLACCGRPMISNGMLGRAVKQARRNVAALYPWAAEGKPILACEPSCILTIKDDYPALLRGEERRKAETVAGQCFTFEEFVEGRLAASPDSAARFQSGPKRVLVQGHCHQRSLVGMGPTMRLLRRIPGAEVIDLDAGCCGMAGSFGYEKEHYEVSRLVGEQRLFPALRQAGPEDVVVAPGFSCRLQIQHFTGRTALHPAQLLRSLLPAAGE